MKNLSKIGLYVFFLWCLGLFSFKVSSQCINPSGIPTSEMILWLCPDSLVYNSLGNPASIGDEIYEWHDISGNNWIFQNTLNNRRPVLDTVNGKTYLKFNSGDFLENVLISDSINGKTEFSIFAVVKSNLTNTDNGFLYHKNPPDGQDDGLSLRYDASGANTGRTNIIKAGLLGNNGGNQIETTSNTQTTDRQVISITWKGGGKLYSYLDSIQNDSSNNNVAGPMNGISSLLIGKGAKDNNSNEGWDGYIETIIFYKKQFSSDTIKDIGQALPIELLSFTAKLVKDKVQLNWSTASETNNDFFTVEKSLDGTSFEKVAVVDGAGFSYITKNYSINDYRPYTGVSYYRLKQTDFNGNFSYSTTVPVKYYHTVDESNIIVYPNPSNGTFNLKIDGFNKNEEMKIVLRDIMGRKYFSMKTTVTENGNALVKVNEQLPSGVYVLICHAEGKEISSRVIIDVVGKKSR